MRPKIIATLGLFSDKTPAFIPGFKKFGVDIFRLNMSHTNHYQLEHYMAIFNRLGITTEKILFDLQGPKIRIGVFKEGFISLENNSKFIIDTEVDKNYAEGNLVGVDFPNLHQHLRKHDTLLLDDGKIILSVIDVKQKQIICEVIQGGKLCSKKGINKVGGGITQHSITEKDLADINEIAKYKPHMVALSFVSDGSDVLSLRDLFKKHNQSPQIISKIERKEAIDNLEEISKQSDLLMIARGDLSLEVGITEIPIVQDKIYKVGKKFNKDIIHATQVLESMINNPTPTCAEVNDIANAVKNEAFAIMLSSETASGKFPFHSIKVLSETIEKNYEYFMNSEQEIPIVRNKNA